MKEEFNQKYWNEYYSSPGVVGSQNDLVFQALSHDVLLRFVPSGSDVLVAGCGNGHGFDKYMERGCRPVGFDFSESGIASAKARLPDIDFSVLDMTVEHPGFLERFDVVVTERSLTNLSSIEKQRTTIGILAKYLKPNGTLLICEPYKSGYGIINSIRMSFGLDQLTHHENAVFIDDELFHGTVVSVISTVTFGVYSLISRIIYPVMIFPDKPKFNSVQNKIAAAMCLRTIGDSAYNNLPSQHKVWICRK